MLRTVSGNLGSLFLLMAGFSTSGSLAHDLSFLDLSDRFIKISFYMPASVSSSSFFMIFWLKASPSSSKVWPLLKLKVVVLSGFDFAV
jgi:hypothetical protein